MLMNEENTNAMYGKYTCTKNIYREKITSNKCVKVLKTNRVQNKQN